MKQFLLLAIWLLFSIYTSAQTAPVANPDTLTTNEDTPVTFNVTTNDTDIDGNINVSTVDLDPATSGIQTSFTVSGEGTYQTIGSGNIIFTPVANYNGTATPVNYTVSDSLGAVSNISSINITVTAINDAPSFTKGLDQAICENSGVQTVNNWATALSAGPINESSQLLSFTATNNNNTLFTVQPAINATGNLTYTPALNQNGSATITVQINDNGGIANGGVDKSADQTFSITINPLPVPTFTASAGLTTCIGTDVTYTTQGGGGIINYVWSVPGTLGVDYSITSGGIGTSSNTVTLKWLTAGSKTVTVNYSNSSSCAGLTPATSTTTVSALPVPTFTASAGLTTCVGTDVTYITQGGGGITNYNWSVPGTLGVDYSISSGGIGISSNTVTLKWLTSGSKTVTVNYSNSGGCSGSTPATNTTNVVALPTIYNVTGGGSYCSGGIGVVIGLSGSQTGVSYQLYSGASPVGSAVSGTGSAISFGNQTVAGANYNVIGTNATSCSQAMNGSATITVNAIPTIYNVTGGGSYCSGGSGVAIGLSGSETGVSYQLYSGASPVGSPISGTGSAISFGNQTVAGANYNVIATNAASCTQAMNGSVSVTVNALPIIYNVTGGGSYCSGGSGVAIGLSGSQTGVSYQLYSGASSVGSAVSGTGSAISFGNQTVAGANYNVIGTNATSCTQAMNGSVAVVVNPLPASPIVNNANPGNICPLKTVDLTSLLTSTTPIGGAILYKATNDPLGISVADPTKAGAGTYYLFYQNSTGCYSASTA
ncbi:MAG TPA: Ig-like domain-containing protein, partial [Paludibacter sp.]